MSAETTTLDAVDRAFLRRAERPRPRLYHTDAGRRNATGAAAVDSAAAAPSPPLPTRATAPPLPATPRSAGRASADVAAAETAGPVLAPADGIVPRLVAAAAAAWEWTARRIEEARREGAEVIAVAGGRRGEGRTTVVRCLARVLEARGWRVDVHDAAPIDLAPPDGDGDRRIVLVDAGIWFPAGPLRRGWLQRQSLGCHAAILVRRADHPECPARGTAVEAVGVRVLGEVVTRVPADAPSRS